MPAASLKLEPHATASIAKATPNYVELFVLFVSSRVLTYVIAGLGLLGIGKPANYSPPHSIADWFLRWDATWYLDLATNGYHFGGAPGSTNVGYFPLYSLLVKAASLGGLINMKLTGYIVALAGLWLACVLLWQLVYREWQDCQLAMLAVAFLLFSPVSFFFSAMYSESWFLPLSIGCFVAARSGRLWTAGALGALAAFTRYVGIALIVPLAWEWIVAVRLERRTPPAIVRAVLASLLPATGYLGYCCLMWAKFGNPHMYAQAQLDSGRHFTLFWGLFARESFWGIPTFYQIWFASAVLIGFGLALAGVALRASTTFAMYVLTFGFIYISARFVDSLPRYFAGLFPMYIALALIVRRWPQARTPLLAGCAMLQTFSIILFVNGYWFT